MVSGPDHNSRTGVGVDLWYPHGTTYKVFPKPYFKPLGQQATQEGSRRKRLAFLASCGVAGPWEGRVTPRLPFSPVSHTAMEGLVLSNSSDP